MFENKRPILVTGATGMVGTALKKFLLKEKPDEYFVFVSSTKTEYHTPDGYFSGYEGYDLTEQESVRELFKMYYPDRVIHLAAMVGGIGINSRFPGCFYYENIMMNTFILEQASTYNAKVVSCLSSCVYPDKANYPLTEDQLHNGPPHESNFGYAYAKRMLEVQSRAFRRELGDRFVCVIPNNLFGKYDNFDLEEGHVIPAIIRKIFEAKHTGNPPTFWGDGTPLREFTYADDLAKILLWALENYNDEMPLNVGNTEEHSIRSVVNKVCEIFEYEGSTSWDFSKPSGQFRKPTDNTTFKKLNPEFTFVPFDDALKETCEWFKKNYPNVRGINV